MRQPAAVQASENTENTASSPPGGASEVFAAFFKLGCSSFGGPIAHLGYFHDELVVRRRWLGAEDYAELVALCQFLPGPASSQLGFALGLQRAGWRGAIAAFFGFTLPSALLMLLCASLLPLAGGPWFAGALHGLKIVAVAIVAQALWGMQRSLCPDPARASIAAAAVAVLALLPGPLAMVAAIGFGAAAGLALRPVLPSPAAAPRFVWPVSRKQSGAAVLLLLALLVLLPLLARYGPQLALSDAFFRAGALVFGGGHVVLPLLEAGVVQPGWISPEAFLAGYGAAQAMPGPLFSFAAYLGALIDPDLFGWPGAIIALLALFLPGFLILIAALPYWSALRCQPRAQAVMQGMNAAVVGILAAALYDPVMTGALFNSADFALAVACFTLLMAWKMPPWQLVIVAMVGGMLLT